MEESLLLALLKLAFMLLFVAIVLLVGSLPLRSRTFTTNPLIRTLGTTFAGALFLNVSILHILPESADTIQQHLQDGDPDKEVFPLANLLVICGFLVTIFFTRIIATHSHHQHHHHEIKESLVSKEGEETAQEEEEAVRADDAYFLTVAMYFHTVFEGIAIGVQDSLAGFLSTAIAIAFHKWADALSMGIYYRNRQVQRRTAYGLIIGQAALNMLAIGFGWAIDSLGDYVEAIFLSISAGTFLAISTMEMLGESLHDSHYRGYKFAILLASTAIISSVWFLENAAFSDQ